MDQIANTDGITLSLLTLISLGVNVLTIYRWVLDYKNKETLNDQAFHMLIGLANSVSKKVGMIVRRIDILKEQDRENDESMIFLENMWSDSMSTADNLLAAAKALKPRLASTLPHDSNDLLQVSAAKFKEAERRINAT